MLRAVDAEERRSTLKAVIEDIHSHMWCNISDVYACILPPVQPAPWCRSPLCAPRRAASS